MSAHVVRDPHIKKHDEKQQIADDCLERGDLAKAIKLSRENLAWSEKVLGRKDPVTLADRDNLAFALHENGIYQEAVALDEGTLQTRRKEQGAEDLETLETQHSLALNFYSVGRYRDAADLDRKTLKARETKQGQRHADTLSSRHNLAAALQELKAYDEAETLNRAVLGIRQRRCQSNDPDLISSKHNLAANLYALRRYDQAAPLLQQNLDTLRKARNKDDEQLAKSEKLFELNDRELSQQKEMEKRKAEEKKKEEKRAADKAKAEKRAEERKRQEKMMEEKRLEERKQEEKRKADQAADEKKKMEEKKMKSVEKAAKASTDSPRTEQGKDSKESNRDPEHIQSRKVEGKDENEKQRPSDRDQSRNARTGKDEENHKSSKQPKTSDQAPATDKVSPPFRHIDPKDVPRNHETSTREKGSLTNYSALSLPPEKKNQRRRAKSDQDLANSSSKAGTLEIPNAKPERRKSVGPVPDRGKGPAESSRRKSLDVTGAPEVANVLSEFYDAHIGDNSSYVSDAADKWFNFLRSNTQPLLEPYRKDRMRRVKIAILDTGVDRSHGKMDAQWDKRVKGMKSWVKDEDADVDHCGHGTHGAALLMRIAPEAHMYVARVAKDRTSPLDPDSVAQAIMHATDEWKVDIITMSFGFFQRYSRIVNAIKHAWLKDVIIFAAASNDGAIRKIAFPANLSSMVMCINSADGGGARSRYNPPAQDTGDNFSTIGEAVSSAWPTKPGKADERRQWGTSTSAPIAAAIAALVLEFEKQPNLTISHRTLLKSFEGMREVFSRMSEAKDGYNFVVPWNLLHKQFSRDQVAAKLSVFMDDKFGAEIK